MYRAMAILSVVAGLGVLSWAAPGPKQPPSMGQKINQRINFRGIDDPKTTLDEALTELSKKYEVSFDINEMAFKMDGLMEVRKTPVAEDRASRGGIGGVAPPVPLTPPPPKAKPAAPDKPAKDQSQARALPSRNLVVFRERAALAAKDEAKSTKEDRHRELRQKLGSRIKFDGFDDPKTTLSEALDALAKKFNLTFDINEEAFKTADVKAALKAALKAAGAKDDDIEVAKFYLADITSIPEMRTNLETALRKILSRVPPSTTFLVRDDAIEITTTEAILKEFFANRPPMPGPLPPLVSVTFDKLPLEAALKELNRSGNVVLDSRAAKEAQTTVTAELTNVPLDTTVRMLADMAGLKVVPRGNVLYVTSKDNARVLLEEQEKLMPKADKP